jgi:hypothetical protein
MPVYVLLQMFDDDLISQLLRKQWEENEGGGQEDRAIYGVSEQAMVGP